MQSLTPPSDWHLDLTSGQIKPMLFENNLVAKGQIYQEAISSAKSKLLALIKNDNNESNVFELKHSFSHHTM